MNCSKQLHTYLRFRRNGTPRDDAAFMAGINIAEALSTDAEEAAGRLADIDTKSPWAAGQSDLPASTDTQMPHLDTQQPTEPAAVATTIQRPETDVNAGQGTGRDAPAMDGSGSPSTPQETATMARRARTPKAEQVEQVIAPDFDLAVKIYRGDILPAQGKVGEFAQEMSTAYKEIKKRANIQPQAAKLAFKLDGMEESKRDDFLRSLKGLLLKLRIFMPTDLVDAAEGKGAAGEEVIPTGDTAKPKLATVPAVH